MVSPLRRLALIGIASLAMIAVGCGSNNKGKIVGKWKVTSATGQSADGIKKLEEQKISYFIEFKVDNSVTMSFEVGESPFAKEMQGMLPTYSFKYRLKNGDLVEFYDLPKDLQEKGGLFGNKDRGLERIKITGDNMTLTEETGTLNLVRAK